MRLVNFLNFCFLCCLKFDFDYFDNCFSSVTVLVPRGSDFLRIQKLRVQMFNEEQRKAKNETKEMQVGIAKRDVYSSVDIRI